MNRKSSRSVRLFVMVMVSGLLGACGGGGSGTTTTPTPPVAPPPVAAAISLSASATSVASDNSTSTTIAATVVDASNAAVAGVTVAFSADTGFLSTASAVSDASGKATVTFSSGTSNPSSRTATITATASGKSTQIPIRISGATVTVASTASSLVVGGSNATLTVTVKSASGSVLPGQAVTLTTSGTGSVTLTPATGTTDATGAFTSVVTPGAAGPVTVTVSAVGETRTFAYTVTGASVAFQITAPAIDPSASSIGTPVMISVAAPPPTTSVVFVSTLGTWDATGSSVVTKTVTAGIVSANLVSTASGVANVQVYDAAQPSVSATRTISFTAAASAAARITLQASPSVVAPSTGGTTGVASLVASVTDASGNPVGGAAVAFSIRNPTGGGETITPAVALTSSVVTSSLALGQAKTTFTAGSLPSGAGGVQIQASVVGTSVATGSGTSGSDATIVIGGTAGSIAIGQSTVISDGASSTIYTLPMSVLVADSNGNAVANAVVSLSTWPIAFNIGGNVCPPPAGSPATPGTFYYNEDANENLVLDPGEDGTRRPYFGGATTVVPGDGTLSPPNSSAGTLPTTVTTGTNGVATFMLTYTKSSAGYILDRIRARTLVQGTETLSEVKFVLPYSLADLGPPCLLGASTFK